MGRGGPVLITGASGLLGTWLRRTAPPDIDLVCLVHRTALDDQATVAADLRDPAAVAAAFELARPAAVIHAAYALDGASIVDATRHVAAASAEAGAHLLFVSTDAVFSGDGVGRVEQAEPSPTWDYGRWKAIAEDAVRGTATWTTVVRLPLVVSLDPADHVVKRIQQAAAAGETARWFDDELRQPARASELAAAIWAILALGPDAGSGTWHLPGPEHLSRFEIAQRVVAALDLPDAAIAGEPTPPGLDRPRHLHLLADRARAAIGWDPSPILR